MKSALVTKRTDVDADFYWPNITVGNTLDAIRFATTNKTYLLLNGFPDVNSLDLPGSIAGAEQCWAAVIYDAYNKALVPFSGPLTQIRVEGSTVAVHTSQGSLYRIAFDHLNMFTTNNVAGVEEWLTKKFCYNKVVDWYDVYRGGDDPYELVNNIDPSIKKVSFYKSNRIDGREYYDVFSLSQLSEEQLVSHEYSDTATRFKIRKIAKDLGKDIVLKFWKRDVFKVYDVTCSEATPQNISWRGQGKEAH